MFLLNRKNHLSLVIIGLITMLTSCSESLKPLKKVQTIKIEPSVIQVEVCDPPEQKEADEANILFILDISGSNSNAQTGGQGTDDDRSQRYGNLITYLNERINSSVGTTNEKYALIEFSTDETIVNGNNNYQANGNDSSPFLPIDEYINTVTTQRNSSTDFDGTPYIETFSLAKELIMQDLRLRKKAHEEDPDKPKKRADYFIFFLSDGAPCSSMSGGSRPGAPAGCVSFGEIKDDDIDESVKRLIRDPVADPEYGKFARRILMNTGFYHYDSDFDAEQRLKRLAGLADGEFFAFTQGKRIDYNEFVNIRIRRVIAENRQWYIQNLNASFNNQTMQMELDSDADGVPDSLESPVKNSKGEYCMLVTDCDGDGILDGVEAMTNENGVVCDNPDCKPTQDIGFCLLKDGKTFKDSDGDLLPDCWEEELGIHEKETDTNFDGIPDPVAFYAKYFLGREGLENNPLESDNDNDRLTDMDEIRRGTPYNVHNDYIKGLKPIKFTLKEYKMKKDVTNPCRIYTVEDLPIMKEAQDDLVRIILVDQEKFGTSKKTMRYAEKNLTGGLANFTLEDFKDNTPVIDTN